jgi:hypothetical protein
MVRSIEEDATGALCTLPVVTKPNANGRSDARERDYDEGKMRTIQRG